MGDIAAALEYKQQARDFMEKAWHYLAADDLHQACEKGLGRCRSYGQGRG